MSGAVTRAIERARTLVDRASAASASRQKKARLKKAIRLLTKAARGVRRQQDLPVDCVVALGSNLEQVRLRAERLARTL
jgi:hypothetical protein